MSDETGAEPPEGAPESQMPPGVDEPTPEELAAFEEQLREVRVEDLVVQSVVSIVNLTARRIGKEDERDLDQAKVGIEAVRALVGVLPEEVAAQIREALSQLQLLFAQAAGGGVEPGDETGAETGPGATPGQAAAGPESGQQSPPPAPDDKLPPRLWTPPGTS